MEAVFLIPTLNRPNDLRVTLENILPLLDDNLGLVLVDDASTDAEHQKLIRRIQSESKYVSVVRLAHRHGCTRARKHVLNELDVPFVIMLDDDSHPATTAKADIEAILNRFRADPSLAAQALPCFIPRRHNSLRDVVEKVYDGRFVGSFINCACAIRTSAYHEVGGYAEEYESPYGEERDLSIRLLDKGWTIRQYNSPAIIHQQTLVSRNAVQNARGNAVNYLRFIWWYHPSWIAIPFAVSTIVKLIGHGLKRDQSLKGTLLGFADFIREFRGVRKRKPVRASTLKLFYGLKSRTLTHPDELVALGRMPWYKIVFGARVQYTEQESIVSARAVGQSV